MNSTRFAAIYDNYRKTFQEAQAARLTYGLNEQEYIKLAMAAESLDNQDVIMHKLGEFEKRQPQIAQLQKQLADKQQEYTNFQQETMKSLRELNQSIQGE